MLRVLNSLPVVLVSVKSEDTLLIAQALKGSEKAYSSLTTKYWERVFSFVRRKGYDKATAEDITQDTFLKAFRYLKSFNTDMLFYTWLCSITKNVITEYVVREEEPEIRENVYDTPETLLEERHDVLALLKPLPVKQQYAVYYKHVHEMTYNEIAEKLGCSGGYAKILVHRGIKTLRSERDKQ